MHRDPDDDPIDFLPTLKARGQVGEADNTRYKPTAAGRQVREKLRTGQRPPAQPQTERPCRFCGRLPDPINRHLCGVCRECSEKLYS